MADAVIGGAVVISAIAAIWGVSSNASPPLRVIAIAGGITARNSPLKGTFCQDLVTLSKNKRDGAVSTAPAPLFPVTGAAYRRALRPC